MALAVETCSLTRKFDKLIAVNAVSLEIKEGEVFGLLGPNGAGKTTLVSVLTTQLLPTRGKAFVWDYDILKQAHDARAHIGIVFQEMVIEEDLTALEALEVAARLYKVPNRAERIESMLKLVGLLEHKNKVVREFSGGMKRRLELARGLLHKPKVLFLDEPTLGLDPNGRRQIWEHIQQLKKEGTTVFLTTHYLEEADDLCDRVAIMNRGKIVVVDTPEKLKKSLKGDTIRILLQSIPGGLEPELKAKSWILETRRNGKEVKLTVKDAERRFRTILELFRQKNCIIRSISLEKPTLEQVFFHYTGEDFT